MRFSLILILWLVSLPGLAQAGTVLASVVPTGGASSTASAPAKTAPTIIPGSPLAALTGASPTPPPPDTNTPFGTRAIGFTLSAIVGDNFDKKVDDFTSSLRRSLRMQPIMSWFQDVTTSPRRHNEGLAILRGLCVAVVPGIALDILFTLLLRRPARYLARRATPQADSYFLPPHKDRAKKHLHAGLSWRGWSKRCYWAFLKFFMLLLPLAGFILLEIYLLSLGLITSRAAHLAIVGFTNAYICARLAQSVLTLLLSPQAPSLRLIRIPSPYAQWGMRRAMILVLTIFGSFYLISSAEILGLSDTGSSVLIRIAALIIHLEIAVWIWQSRRVVGRWIAGAKDNKRFLSGLRQRIATVWHIFAILYVLALWVAWAVGVHNALLFTMRAILVAFIALLLGRATQIGAHKLFLRVFPEEGAETKIERSIFLARVKVYTPLIRFLFRAIVILLILALMLEGWGVDAVNWLFHNTISHALLSAVSSIVITVTVAILCWEFATYQLDKRIETLNQTNRTRQAARLRTLSPMLRAALGVVVVMLALIIGLSRIGVNTSGLLAVSSVVGIAVGFGSQKLVQDVITGLFLLFEDAVQVGDSVSLGGLSGTVERLSIRTIRLRGGDGSVNIIPFSSVTTVTNQTRDFSLAQISIMVGYKENVDRVTALLKDIGAQMRSEPGWSVMIRDDVQIFGLDAFGELGLVITGQIRTGPGQHAAVRREFQARVQKRFADAGIEMPYRHQTLQLELPPGLEMIDNQPPPRRDLPDNRD